MTTSVFHQALNRLKDIIKGTEFENNTYSVGGCERDYLMNREIKDIDLVVSLPNGGIKLANYLNKIGALAGKVVTYEHFGTAMFCLKDFPDIELEAVQTRKECYHDMESRNPETAFGTISDDCQRRDFTYNAIYRNISTGGIHDFNGKSFEDLKSNILRTCGEPNVIYSEDPLRILRCIRFSSRFSSNIEKETYNSMIRNVDRLSIISQERIQDEFNKIITSDNKGYGLRTLLKIGAMPYIFTGFTEIDEGIIEIVECGGKSNSLVVNLALLLFTSDDPIGDMQGLKYSNDIINQVWFLINTVFFIDKLAYDEESVRRLQYRTKTKECFAEALEVYLGLNNDHPFIEYLKTTNEKLCADELDMFGYKLPVDGYDIMDALGIGAGKIIREKLDLLIEKAYLCPTITKEECLKLIKK